MWRTVIATYPEKELGYFDYVIKWQPRIMTDIRKIKKVKPKDTEGISEYWLRDSNS